MNKYLMIVFGKFTNIFYVCFQNYLIILLNKLNLKFITTIYNIINFNEIIFIQNISSLNREFLNETTFIEEF